MSAAIREAKKALQAGEVPVGAVVVHNGRIISRGHNRVESKQDASYHAEMVALRRAARRLSAWRLEKCQLYVTLEPCAMCAGAAVWSRVEKIIFGVKDPKAGACGSVVTVAGNRKLNHRPVIVSGVMALECGRLLRVFFQQVRYRNKLRSIEVYN